MKRTVLFFGLIIFLATACEKEEDILYSQDQLNGTWETSEKNSLGCGQQLEISSDGLSEIKVCAGIKVKMKAKNYSFNGRIIKYELYGLDMEFEISVLTDQRLMLGYNNPIEYTRILK